MKHQESPIFYDGDPHTGELMPTSYDSMRDAIRARYPLQRHLPADIFGLLDTATDYISLAYEQANTGRGHLYEHLTNDAFLKVTLALELALRHRLSHGRGMTLEKLIRQGLASKILPDSDQEVQLWKMLRENRNALAHGDPAISSYGPATAHLLGTVIEAINALDKHRDDRDE